MEALSTTLIGGTAVFVGGTVQGCVGFGFGMIALTPLLFLMDPPEAVPTLMMLSMLNTVPIALSNRTSIRPGIVGPLLAGALFGAPLGVAAILILDGPVFRATVGLVLLSFAVVLALGWSWPLPRPRLASIPVGFVSGIMSGSTSMAGPPVVMFLTNQSAPKDVFRTNIVAYFSCVNVVSLSVYAMRGVIGTDLLMRTALFAPVMLAGTYLGARISRRASELLFRRVTLACAGIMGLILLVRNALALLN